MRILGIDTSTKYAGIAVLEDGILLAQSTMQFMASHSEKLLPEIAHILEIMKIPLETIDYYAITVGPGSFTGLRVGISTAKGLSFVTKKKVIPVSTLEVIAWEFPYCKYQICPIFDARKKEVFTALFKWENNKILRLKEDSVLGINALVDWIKEKTIFAGSGADFYKEKLIEKLGSKAIFPPLIYSVPHPGIVAYIGLQRINEATNGKDLKPEYLRKSEAEIKITLSTSSQDKV
ncbi:MULTISPECIES: tRNA (adenosine(37)-N6)-threonylcarbamoyltransferase complex dimerization subunit type 1 TsaB [Thermodesulfovibrio]|uniref:Glycoprotein endopeptidase n=1 Tax=Thermodesulfovibrio yellowstonii (strain ATCC 51303 / DSM 11347 / YP87) TaxID=289376 RepID=B5YJL1_THEYD|nr:MULTISPECIES: tRNA (adenosine(37)-N6)-threonylcarbamoyltransferase complex dimerization subunit type 1 TsaB [Thermodesulfovibrio]ACI21548.1 glycoprotein endopeptidase [Thermodesulfovibrio yellowstonii DSM 11347]